MRVVSPGGVPPWPLSLHPHYRAARRLPAREEWKGLQIYRPRFPTYPGFGLAGAAKRMARALLPLLREIRREFPFDAIDAEFFWPDGVAAMHLAAARGVPFSIKARGSDIDYWGVQPGVREQMIAAAAKAGALLAVSAALRERMVALGMPNLIQVHYTGIDFDRFRPLDRGAAKAELGVEGPLIVSVGALIPLKGHRLIIEALAELPGATLLIAGEGPERPALERLAEPFGGRVRLLGNRPHGELPKLLAAADAMVLPSEREGLANAWVEALACGTPLVITDVGGAREVVDRRAAGRLVARDATSIAHGIRSILASAPDAAAARASAARFSWERNGAELAAALRRISGQLHQRGGDPSLLAAQQAPDPGGGAAVHHLEPDPARIERGA